MTDLLAERFAALVEPGQEDWADVLQRARPRRRRLTVAAVAVAAALVTAAAVVAAGGWLFTKHGDTVSGQTSVQFHGAKYTVYAEVSPAAATSASFSSRASRHSRRSSNRSRSQAATTSSPHPASRPNPRYRIRRPRPDRRSPEPRTFEGAARSCSAMHDLTSGVSNFATAKVTPSRPRRLRHRCSSRTPSASG